MDFSSKIKGHCFVQLQKNPKNYLCVIKTKTIQCNSDYNDTIDTDTKMWFHLLKKSVYISQHALYIIFWQEKPQEHLDVITWLLA